MSNYTIGLSGLQNTASALDTVSNNIANANTVGYKAGEYLFADQFIKAVNPADAARVGMGSQTQGVRRAMTQGTINNSQNPLDMAISGDGMFRLKRTDGVNGGDPSGIYYTRNGQFRLDTQRRIVNENGMVLTGFPVTETGETQSLSPDLELTLPPDLLNGTTTRQSSLSAVIDSRGAAFTSTSDVAFDPTQDTYNNKTTQTVYDTSGNPHTLEVFYRRISSGSLDITGGATGWTYSPGQSARPDTLGTSLVTLNPNSVVRVNTAANHTDTVASSSTGTSVTLSNTIANVAAGDRVFRNGLDTGLTVSATSGATVTLSASLGVNTADALSFYSGEILGSDISPTGATTDSNTVALTGDLTNDISVGDRIVIGGADSGLAVGAISVSGGNTTITLANGKIASFATTDDVNFIRPLNMSVVTPDGTEVEVSGISNKLTDGATLSVVTQQVEAYASIDGRFYDYQEDGVVADWNLSAQTTGLGYKPIAIMQFVSGRNIDSLVSDPLSGNPQFRTETQLTADITAQDGGVSTLDFKLDLSDTKLMAQNFLVEQSVQDGEPVSRLTNVTVDNMGRVVAVYGTGKQIFVGQVALVRFDNAEGLIPVGNNAFAASVDSGTEHSAEGVHIGYAGSGSFGEIRAMALESSNVDLANELVKLMILQRSYTANSQSMRAADQLVRDTLNMSN